MKKIMILGASILQLPAILEAKKMGLQVIAVDMDLNAIGFKEADICLNISTIDISEVIKAAKTYNIDGIMTLASDMPMRTVAAVAKELNIVGISEDTALKATNKALMRQCMKENNVPIPTFYRVSEKKDYLSAIKNFDKECIVKPADNSGSRGVFLIEDLEDLDLIEYAYRYSKKHSRGGEIVIEEYMRGAEVSVETLSTSGKVHVIAITDKFTTGAPKFIEMGHSQPSMLKSDIQEEIKKVVVKAVNAVGIKDGPSHTEIIITEEGPKVVEIGARLGGDSITTHLVPLSTGVNMVGCCIEIALGNSININNIKKEGSAIRFFKANPGRITDIREIEEAKKIDGVDQIYFTKKIGETIGEFNSSTDRVGHVIAKSDTPDNAISICNQVIDIIKIKINQK